MGERIIPSGKRFYVNKLYDVIDSTSKMPLYLKTKTYVSSVIPIAVGENIKDVKRLIMTYRLENGGYTDIGDWCKMRGTATVTDGDHEFKAEVHWYECPNIGKIEFKVKSRY